MKQADLLSDEISVRAPTAMPPLLLRLTERKPENLDYLGVSYGLTSPLLRSVVWALYLRIGANCISRFWKRAGYVPLYLRQTTSELTGEHTCVMVRGLNSSGEGELGWMGEFGKGAVSRTS
jgi:N-acetyltransferase 10